MKKRKKIWIPIVSIVLVCAIGAGLAVYFTHKKKTPVHVYNIDENMLWTQNWDSSNTSDGMVTTDKLQTVFVSATQEVTEVYVQEGQKVKKGDKLMSYDTTLSQLSLDRAKLEIERSKLRLEDAKDQLAEIKKMKPISYNPTSPTTKPTTKPTTPSTDKPSREFGNGEEYMILSGQGTSADPKVIWAKQSAQFSDKVLAELLNGADKAFLIIEVRKSDKASGAIVSRIGMQVTKEVTKVTAPAAEALRAEGTGSYGISLLADIQTEPPETSDPGNDTEPSQGTEPSEDTEPSQATEPTEDTKPTDPSEPTNPTDPVENYVEVIRYSIVFFQPDDPPKESNSGSTSGSTSGGSSGGGVNVNSGYTSSEIAQMRSDKEAEIKELEFSIRMAEAEYKIMQKEFDNGVVVSDIDGYVVSVQSPEDALLNDQPVIKVSGGGGFLIQGSVSELNLDDLVLGQVVEVSSWSSGMTYQGTITEIGDYPVEQYGYMGGNPNVSYYPFTVSVDDSADLQEGSYVQLTYNTADTASENFYLEKAFIRSEKGVSYVFVKGEDGLLEKREIQTGPSLYGSYLMILSGVEKTDSIAFPYGSNMRVGSPTEEAQTMELYENY